MCVISIASHSLVESREALEGSKCVAPLMMGVPVSVKRPTPYEFSFASFSTTGTLQSSMSEGNEYFLCFQAKGKQGFVLGRLFTVRFSLTSEA